MDKSITENYIFYKCIVTSLVIVVMVSGELFSFFKNYMSFIIQYTAVTQNINTILYQCIYIYNLCIVFLALKYEIYIVHLDAALAELCLQSNETQHSQGNILPTGVWLFILIASSGNCTLSKLHINKG